MRIRDGLWTVVEAEDGMTSRSVSGSDSRPSGAVLPHGVADVLSEVPNVREDARGPAMRSRRTPGRLEHFDARSRSGAAASSSAGSAP